MVCFQGRSIVPRPYSVRVLLKLPSAQSPFARARCDLARRGLTDHVSRCYPAFIAPTGSCASPPPSSCLGRTLNTRSVQVAVSPCWEKDLPDVISAHLSLRAWTPTPAARVVHLPVSSHTTSAFPPFGPGRRSTMSVQRFQYGAFFEAAVIHSCSGPQVCSPPRSLLPIRPTPYGSRDFSIRASRFVTSPCPDMLAVRIGQLTAWGLSPHQMRSLVGCSPNAQGSAAGAELPPTSDWATEPKTTAIPPSACNPLLGARADGRCRGNLGKLLFQPLLSVPQVMRLLHA